MTHECFVCKKNKTCELRDTNKELMCNEFEFICASCKRMTRCHRAPVNECSSYKRSLVKQFSIFLSRHRL